MNESIPQLVHLAGLIDAKERKLEQTKTPFIRRCLMSDLESLIRRFQAEYERCLASGASAGAQLA
jgi:hypothetical protein